MRLSVFIPQLTAQLLIDLKKLYQDHLPENALLDSSLTNDLVESEKGLFFVTKFNDRHLGAVRVEVEGAKAKLNMLCIREVTRRRGIAKNLLREVEIHLVDKKVKTVNMALNDFSESNKNGVTDFMLASNYTLQGDQFVKQL